MSMHASAMTTMPDDFDRPVHCLAGLPFDAVDMAAAVERVRRAAATREPCFLSTPNLNFLIGSLDDADFRDSVIHSDLSVADGMPLVWMARLLGVPIRERVAGSGLFEALWRGEEGRDRLAVYFFGGQEGAAERACANLNAAASGLRCVGFECPGFGDVPAMSGSAVLDAINSAGADFLVVALGARKGQAWIEHNRGRIDVPVISHLGAVVNFAAGTVSRAPDWMQRAGLEWLWRIKEEPGLWRRYGRDGWALIRLLLTRLLPYWIWLRLGPGRGAPAVWSGTVAFEDSTQGAERTGFLRLAGDLRGEPPAAARQAFRRAAAAGVEVVADFAAVQAFGSAALGLLLMLRKHQDAHGLILRLSGLDRRARRLLHWNGAGYLLEQDGGGSAGGEALRAGAG